MVITVTVTEKKCGKCGRTLPAKDFWRQHRGKDGLQAFCKDCQYGLPPGTKTTPNLSNLLSIVPGLTVRQIRPDAGRLMEGMGTVLARKHELIEVRDSDGKTRNILAAHLEVTATGT
jgi:hypothetical protein